MRQMSMPMDITARAMRVFILPFYTKKRDTMYMYNSKKEQLKTDLIRKAQQLRSEEITWQAKKGDLANEQFKIRQEKLKLEREEATEHRLENDIRELDRRISQYRMNKGQLERQIKAEETREESTEKMKRNERFNEVKKDARGNPIIGTDFSKRNDGTRR